MAPGSVSLPISSAGVTHSAAGLRIPTLRLWVELAFARYVGSPLPCKCLLNSGAPLCIIPFAVHHTRNFAWQPLPGPWPSGLTTWLGVPCTLGRMDVWVPIPEVPFLSGP
jgi:hypothetical protein